MSKVQREIQKRLAHIRSIDPKTIVPPGQRFRYDIRVLEDGDVFRLAGHTYFVMETGTYTETDETFRKTYDWTGNELKVMRLEAGTVHNLEWEEDDEIEVTLTLDEVRFSELKYDDGEAVAQDSDDLDEIVEKKWEIVRGGKPFFYSDDYAARYVRKKDGKRENVFFYEFEADDGEQLTIEVWVQDNGKEEFQVFLSRSVPPDDIEVIAAASA